MLGKKMSRGKRAVVTLVLTLGLTGLLAWPASATEKLPGGDLNGDGIVDGRDIKMVAVNLRPFADTLNGDLNGDGEVNVTDLLLLTKRLRRGR